MSLQRLTRLGGIALLSSTLLAACKNQKVYKTQYDGASVTIAEEDGGSGKRARWISLDDARPGNYAEITAMELFDKSPKPYHVRITVRADPDHPFYDLSARDLDLIAAYHMPAK